MDLGAINPEREALLAEINAAFAGVSRENGVSWSEREALDSYGSDEERAAARASDTEGRWQELIDDPSWVFTGCADFAFLDAIGSRYYLAPAMVLSIRTGSDVGIRSALTRENRFEVSFIEGPGVSFTNEATCAPGYDQHFLDQWSLLNTRQQQCVARFVKLMIELARLSQDKDQLWGWQAAYDSYWRNFATQAD